jgi:hypothetical protein
VEVLIMRGRVFRSPSLCALVLLALSSGCATIVSGNTQSVDIRTTPPGARVVIRSSNGLVQEVVSPARVVLHTGAEHVVEADVPGYQRTGALVGKTINWWSILGGPGAFYDFVSGSIWDLDPGIFELTLHPAAPPPAPPAPPPPAPPAPPPPPPPAVPPPPPIR